MSLDNKEIYLREQKIIEQYAFTSGTPYEHSLEMLGLSDIAKKSVVVDLAAGASPFVANLLNAGVDAYAVDQIYLNNGALIDTAVGAYLKELAWTFKNYPEMEKSAMQALDQFRESRATHPGRYIGGWLTRLPIAKNFADTVISLHGLLDLAEDEEVLDLAFRSAIDITKPGGRVILAPLYERSGNPDYFMNEHEGLISNIETANIGEVKEVSFLTSRCDGCMHYRLEFIKAISS